MQVLTGKAPERPEADSRREEKSDRAKRSVESLCKRGEQTSGPQQSVNAIASSHSQPKGVWEGRAAHITAKATDSTPEPERVLDLPGVSGGGTLGQSSAEQERPYPAVESDKDRPYKAGRLKSSGAGRESEGPVIARKACNKTRRSKEALL